MLEQDCFGVLDGCHVGTPKQACILSDWEVSTWTLYARLMSSLLSNILLEGLWGKVCPERHLFHRFFVYSSTGFTSDIGLASLALPFGPFSACSNTVKTKFDCWFARQGQTLNGVSSLGSMICCHVVATGLQLERLSSVCMDPLCRADVKPAIKHLLEQAGSSSFSKDELPKVCSMLLF